MVDERFNVCVVDDEPENTLVFRMHMEEYFNIVDFDDPVEASDYLRKSNKVLTVVTDHSMPKLKGIDLAREVRAEKPYLNFVMITGNPENDNELVYNTLRKNLFFDFLTKPFDYENGSRRLANIILTSCSFTWRNLLTNYTNLADNFSQSYLEFDEYLTLNTLLKELKLTHNNLRMTMLFDTFNFFYPDKNFAKIVKKGSSYILSDHSSSSTFDSLEGAWEYLKNLLEKEI